MFENVRGKFTACMRRLTRAKCMRRFVRQQDGAAAVEFALVATPFLALIFAILETAMVFFAGQTLEAAAADSARLIMTGQAQTASPPLTKDTFKEAVCTHTSGLFDCSKVYVDVKTFSDFSSVSNTPPLTNGSLDTAKTGYNTGDVGSIVSVTLYYPWPIFTPLLDMLSSSSLAGGGSRLLVATAVFRNEPYK